jgi:mycothiol synthase
MISNRPYQHPKDYEKIIAFLREMYLLNRDQTCWLPQRWEDMEYRIRTLHLDRGEPDWHDSIHIWEVGDQIVGICNGEDDDRIFVQIRNGYEKLFTEMLDWIENKKNPEIVALDSCRYKTEELIKRGYKKADVGCYHNYQLLDKEFIPNLPSGYEIVFGDALTDKMAKAKVCHLGFHPEDEGDDEKAIGLIKNSYLSREKAPMFDCRFETMTRLKGGELTSYLYCWVDKETSAAMIEPVCTRLEHRHKGLGKAMLVALLKRLKGDGVEICYVESFDDNRKNFYNSAGFVTKDVDFGWRKNS